MLIRQEMLVTKLLRNLSGGHKILMRRFTPLICIVALFALGACSASLDSSSIDYENKSISYEVNDPYEGINRKVFAFNRALDKGLFKHIVSVYKIVPQWGRDRVTNALDNLGEPINFTNSVLQGNPERAGNTFMRFAINSTFGVVGLFDVAEDWGIEYAPEDFGQTAAVWGMDEGPYIVLPLFGPSNPRDALGLVTDFIIDPMGYVLTNDQSTYRFIGNAVDQRTAYSEELDTMESTSVDFYATMRESYRQYRNAEISNSDLPQMMPIPTITIEEHKKLPKTADKSDNLANANINN